MSFLNISIRLQQELEKSFNQEACKVLLSLAEEIYNANSSVAQKIFDDNREILVLNIVERMREVFVTREEFNAKIGQLRSEMQAEFAKIRQEMAELKQELKEDISNVRQEISDVKSELKQEIAEVRQEMAEMKQELKEDISNVRLELKEDISNVRLELKQEIAEVKQELKSDIADLKIKGMYWLVVTGVVVIATIIGANYAMMTFFLEHLSK